MRKIIFIFILLSYYGIKNIQAGYTPIFSVEQIVSLNKFLSEQTESLSSIDSGHSDDHPFSKKGKKRKKAIQPTLVYFADEQYFKIIDLKGTSPYFLEIFYSFCPYFGDDERGPPTVLTVS